MKVIRYSCERKEEWNLFLDGAKNTTFLFNRDYMDYHSDSFIDHSLMLYNHKNTLVGLFPANQTKEGDIMSHQGLTYGSFIVAHDAKLPIILDICRSVLDYYFSIGYKKIIYKSFPKHYNLVPSDEIDYALFLLKANLVRRDTSLVIDKRHPINYVGNIKREAKKAAKEGHKIIEEKNPADFWSNLLTPSLLARFKTKPVHSSEEMQLLMSLFPLNIKIYVVRDSTEQMLAGAVFYLTENVAHCQYIASNDRGRKSGALNLLFTTLVDEYFHDKNYFDFGTCNENNGRSLNTGLLAWKERMGGRTISHDFYEIQPHNFQLIDTAI